MNWVGRILLSGALLAGLAAAQTKVAVINSQRAVLETAEIKKAQLELEAKFRPRQQSMEKLQKDLVDIQGQLQGGKLSPQGEQELTAQGQRKQREMQRMQEDLQADVDRERNDVLQKASVRMQEVVKKLAGDKGLDVVVDAQNTVFFKPALDLTTESIAAYDKAYPVK